MTERLETVTVQLLAMLSTALAEQAPAEALERIASAAGRLRFAKAEQTVVEAIEDAEQLLAAWSVRGTGVDLPTLPSTRTPGLIDRRRRRRFEVFATVRIGRGAEATLLTVRNLSMSGVLLSADGHNLLRLVIGVSTPLLIFNPEDLQAGVSVQARVARREASSVAFSWEQEPGVVAGLLGLISRWSAGTR